ncbi:hypothetical protein Sbs19_42140 [Sphingobium sp. BS19]|nr:hypothetical protein Sbs19_42140 [Sphingobium sp. BS19]
MRYRSCRADDGDLRSRLRELAQQRRRFGYRRLHILLRREGVTINRKKTQRLYREEGLTVRRRKGRRRAVGARAPAPVLALPNQRWSLDFVHDQLATGRRFRILNIVDDVTRECLRAVLDTSISGRRVVRELGDLIAERGAPRMIVSDNGTELRARSRCAHRLRLNSRKEMTMETARCPSGLPGHGYSMQAAAIASALVERENAHIYRMRVRDWLDRIEDPDKEGSEDMDEGRVFAEFLTNLVRVGSGLKAVEQ